MKKDKRRERKEKKGNTKKNAKLDLNSLFLGKLTILRNKMMSSVNVAIGNKAAISCYATGVPPIKYQWTKDGAPISSPAAEVIDNILFVTPTTAEDHGKYTCRVSNKNETVSYVTEVKPLINCVTNTRNQGELSINCNV